MQNLILLVTVILIGLNAQAQISAESSRDLLLAGELEKFVQTVERQKDFNKEISEYYASVLIASGELGKLEKFLIKALEKHSKSSELKQAQKQLFFFKKEYESVKDFTEEEKAQLKLMELFPEYLEAKQASKPKSHLNKLLSNIEAKLNNISNRLPYFPTKLEYLLELDIEQPNSRYSQMIRDEATAIITNNRKKLFPKTLDFYELSHAYRALAVISYREKDIDSSMKFYKLAAMSISKMRSFWLEEDVRVWRPILKIEQRETRFSYVFLQWIIAQVEKFDREYGLLLNAKMP